MSKPKKPDTYIGFVSSVDASRVTNDGQRRQTAVRQKSPVQVSSVEIVDATDLPSDEHIKEIWQCVPESVQMAFGYSDANKSNPANHA